MTILNPTEHFGTVTWLGVVPPARPDIRSGATRRVEVGWEGFADEEHSGLTRPACVRVRRQYPEGTEIRNTRQISIVSAEETAEVAARLGITEIRPEWLGANIVIRGIPDFTLVPPASRLIFANGLSLTVDTENAPCRFPAAEIEAEHPGHGLAFPKEALHRRGVTAWVECPGTLAPGDRCRLHIPPQRIWAHGPAG